MPTLKGKSDLRKILLIVDLGGSKSKATVQLYPEGAIEVLLLDPEVADIPNNSISRVESRGKLENRTWVQTEDGYYALGELARRQFGGILQLKELKYELAVQKICGLVWLAKEKLNLDNSLEIYLAVLLPAGEIQDKDQLRQRLAKTLRKFGTPSGKMQLKILYCDFASEGSGIYFHNEGIRRQSTSPVASTYIMLGYRNASIFSVRSGVISPGTTSEFGMSWLVNNFVTKVSGLSTDDPKLVEIIVQAGTTCDPIVLQRLSRKRKSIEVERDGLFMAQMLLLAKEEYLRAITRWFRSYIDDDVEELVFCGGTTDYLRADLDMYFQEKKKFSISWHGNIPIYDEVARAGLGNRMADVYALHQYILEKIDSKTGHQRAIATLSGTNRKSLNGCAEHINSHEFDYTPRTRPKNFVNVNENL